VHVHIAAADRIQFSIPQRACVLAVPVGIGRFDGVGSGHDRSPASALMTVHYAGVHLHS
jgi:hypothetical protein